MIEHARPIIDLTRYAWRREVGDLTIYGTWVPCGDDGGSEPAIAIVPRFRAISQPAVIALSAAYKYNDPAYAAKAAYVFAKALGMDGELTSVLKVAELIDDHLSDLISMPPEPTEAVAVADVEAAIGGKRHTIELLHHQGI